ncbi:MAG TPA: hypothetical protein VGW10_04505, partial [Solirubrobacteraceae bacterium]|nr:hypothetical protein [Solirubrobacteraceae bacterium]
MHAYRLHGLMIHSDAPLGEPVDQEGPPDVEMRWATTPVAPSDGAQLVAGSWDPERRFFEVYEDADGWTLHALPVQFAARVHRDLRSVEITPGTRGEEFAGVLAAGALLGMLLDLRGEIGLHASAVEVDGQAIAFTGPTGAGKTTIAALACSAGAGLVTDDLLRIALEDPVLCHRGASALRLRERVARLADAPNVLAASRTADERLALRFAPSAVETLPLRAIVLPRLARDAERVEVEPAPRARALAVL